MGKDKPQEQGVTPSGSGHQPTASAADASSQSGVPNAGMLPNVTYVSCPLCNGTREGFEGRCSWCADPDPARVRWMLERLTADQIDFLRAYSHTLAKQPVTDAEYDAHRCEYWVEDCDGEYDEDAGFWLIPNSRHWFAGGEHKMGPAGNVSFIHYSPTGLLLRECLMCGADMALPHMYPARSRQDAPELPQPTPSQEQE